MARWEALGDVRDQVRVLLPEHDWNAARHNTLNAHYTDAGLVRAVWGAVRRLGFDGGQVLEPGSGAGENDSKSMPTAAAAIARVRGMVTQRL